MALADGDRVRVAADVLDAAMPADLSMFVVDGFADLLRSLTYIAALPESSAYPAEVRAREVLLALAATILEESDG